ncbi:hypothetical protein LQ318_15825 [Aliifodinibius salicampi]|uniref:DUF2326 domain-containing protein n=1 Tax=Fodinibius salicampi TaxID=1920655 RepID=A0ABT3Q2V0_9BACT|nr:hypothetical protein [Fodinibius salicampi]MCW9714376.1 hypothetical protein [Fodinibius salicampi]
MQTKKNGEEVTEESVTNKIVEFLRDYGSTIGQLSHNQKVMVIYKTNRPKNEFFIFHSDEENKKVGRQTLPTISVAANASDLKTYRSGNLSDSELRNRLDINSVKPSEEQEKDLRVMANILETAFEDTGEQQFQIRGSVDYLALDNYGALFSFDIRYIGQSHFDFSGLHEALQDMRKDLEKARAQINDFNADREVRDSIATKKREEVQAKHAEEKENIKKAYNQFIKDLKSTITDYGRTLHSIELNQQILVSVTLDTHYEEIPKRIDLHVRKSILENNSREQAMAEIQVREH